MRVNELFPPIAMLRAFAAAARHQSFQKGADDIGVTPSAVSHQVRKLENWLERPLFERSVRQVTLTEAGQALFAAIEPALAAMTTALSAARHENDDRCLRVNVLPLFTNAWLMPRLYRFQARHPDISIDFVAHNKEVDFDRDPIDIAIRTLHTVGPHLISRKLLDFRMVPLCSVELASRITCPADLANVSLIEVSARPDQGWDRWFREYGADDVRHNHALTFDNIPSAIEAATQGRGVVLGLVPLIWDAAAARSLVVPFAARPISAGAYFLVYRKQDCSRRSVRAFIDWITAEMAADHRRLMRAPAQSG